MTIPWQGIGDGSFDSPIPCRSDPFDQAEISSAGLDGSLKGPCFARREMALEGPAERRVGGVAGLLGGFCRLEPPAPQLVNDRSFALLLKPVQPLSE